MDDKLEKSSHPCYTPGKVRLGSRGRMPKPKRTTWLGFANCVRQPEKQSSRGPHTHVRAHARACTPHLLATPGPRDPKLEAPLTLQGLPVDWVRPEEARHPLLLQGKGRRSQG